MRGGLGSVGNGEWSTARRVVAWTAFPPVLSGSVAAAMHMMDRGWSRGREPEPQLAASD